PERFGDVVVGPGVEADDGVDLLGPGREHEDRQVGEPLAQPPADLETGDVGALPAEGGHERLGDRRVVLDQQQAGHGRNLPRSAARTGPAGDPWKWSPLELPTTDSSYFRRSPAEKSLNKRPSAR